MLSREIPSSRSAHEFSHRVWASPEYRATGRLGKAASSEALLGSTGGFQRYSRHPCAKSQPWGLRSARGASRATQSASDSPKNISAKGLEYSAEWNACTCASWKPAHRNASPKSSTRVEGPMNASASPFGTTAQIRPPRTQTAKGRASSLVPVNTFSLIKTDSACMRSPLAHISWRGATAGQRPSGSPRMLRL